MKYNDNKTASGWEPKPGDWFTVSRWIGRDDCSWIGDCIEAVFCERSFVVAKIYRPGPYGRVLAHRHVFDLRRVELEALSMGFVEAALAPTKPAENPQRI